MILFDTFLWVIHVFLKLFSFYFFRQQNWDAIAKELGTNRSSYQCFIVYQNKLNASIKRNLWEPHEDKRLVELVEKFRIGDYIPWAKVL